MEVPGAVSLWIGRANSSRALDQYLEIDYSDEDAATSPFFEDFGIEDHDEDFREAQFFKKPSQSLQDLLKGHSYDDVIIPKFTKLIGETLPEPANAVVLLYNFKYKKSVESKASPTVQLRYMGSISGVRPPK